MPRGAKRAARRPNRTEFSGQKEIPDSVKGRKEKFWDVLINLVDTVSILSRNSGIFSFISGIVHVYNTYTREIFLLWCSGTAFRQAETTMYKLQTYLAT